MKSILFARVSSKDQEDTGYSLPSQEKLLKEYAQRKEFKVAKKFSISESASGRYQRKTFNEMLDFIKKNNIKIIVCEKVDRLTRNLKDAVCINEWLNEDAERQVHFVKDGCILSKDSKSNEKFIWNIKVSVAQYYIDNLSEEVKKGHKEKVAQGWLPTKPPLGYKTVGEKGHKIHVIDDNKAPLVKKMFELYATSEYSLKKLVETMYNQGLRTGLGNMLVKSRLAELLSDPFYYGKLRWNNEVYVGKQEPLITRETFDMVQEVLKSKATPKYRKHFPLFKKLLHCKECGGMITWEIQKGHWYGHCNHYRDCSQKTWVKEADIEKQLTDVFETLKIKSPRIARWVRKALKESHKDEIQYHQSALDGLNQKYKQTQKRLDKLYDDKLDEEITKETYDKKFKQYSEEKENITQAIQKHSQANTKYYELGISIYELSQKAKKVFSKISKKDERRQLLGLIFGHIALDEGKLSHTYTVPFEILSKAIEATNSSKVVDLGVLPSKIFEPAELVKDGSKSKQSARESDGLRTYLRGPDSNRQPTG